MEKKNMLVKLSEKELLSLALAFAMATSMAGCKKDETKTTVPTNATSITTVETTATTTTTTTETSETVSETGLKYEEEANSFYESNEAFFVNEYGNDRDYAIQEINNTILVLTNDSETISNEDLRNTFYAMDNMFMPTNVIQAAGNYVTGEPIEDIENVPNLARYIQDDQAKEIINDNTVIINNFIDAMNNGTEEEKEIARNLVLQRVITIEENHDDTLMDLGELSNGDELALNMSYKGLVNLGGTLVQNGVLNYTDANGVEQTMFLIPDIRGGAILDTFRFAEQDARVNNTPVQYDSQIVNMNGAQTTVYGFTVTYLDEDGFNTEFVSREERETIEDTLAITKYDEAVVMIENEFSQISTVYYELSEDCDSYTLN